MSSGVGGVVGPADWIIKRPRFETWQYSAISTCCGNRRLMARRGLIAPRPDGGGALHQYPPPELLTNTCHVTSFFGIIFMHEQGYSVRTK